MDVILGIGDDCALLATRPNQRLAVSIDTLIAGVHFPLDVSADAIGHKALAVNLSDLAAMGAEPAWCTLALSLPQADEVWLADFCRGFAALADQHAISLVGGDTTKGPLSVTVQVTGWVPHENALRRSNAKVGDKVYVSHCLGGGALGLWAWQSGRADRHKRAVEKLNLPQPRVRLGLMLRERANACIDLSDGLWQDLGHIANASQVGAVIDMEALPLWPGLSEYPNALEMALAGGDDFELCFTAPSSVSFADCADVTCIGEIVAGTGVHLVDAQGCELDFQSQAYDHFKGDAAS